VGEWRRRLAGDAAGPRAVLLVLGCQRSGTTLMTDILGRDPAAKVYPEHSALSARDRRHGLRLAPLPDVASRVAASHFPLIVMKPLVESQRTPSLLDGIPRARGLWMFRHYADVARSNLERFGRGNGIRNLRSIAERRSGDWRSESVPDEVDRVVQAHFSESMNPGDAAALFWWARNHLFFALGLDRRDDLRTCRYEELVADPARVIAGIYHFIGAQECGVASLDGVSPASVGRGQEISLSDDVRARCESMLERLRKVHEEGAACA
jgi:hypothetical protein